MGQNVGKISKQNQRVSTLTLKSKTWTTLTGDLVTSNFLTIF